MKEPLNMCNFRLINSILFITNVLYLLQNVKSDFATNNEFINAHTLSILKDNQNFCKNIKCEKIENCPGVIVANRSFRGCCPACVKFLGEDESCSEHKNTEFGELVLNECKSGFMCVNGKCTFDTKIESCLLQKSTREKLRSKENYADDLWIPDCDAQGYFKAKQKKNKKSICVTPHGETLFGDEDENGLEDMKCECSRHLHQMAHNNERFMTKPQEHCTPSGNFDVLQCIDNLCYCSNETTGAILGRMTMRTYFEKLSCYNETYGKEYLRECEIEQQKSRMLQYELLQKGMNVLGLERVKCDPDGSFSPKQCDSNRCVCTNKHGIGIESHFIEIKKAQDFNINMTSCNCARDRDRSLSRSQSAAFKCEANGDYYLYQCFNKGQCFCVDKEGDLTSKPLKRTNANESFCEDFLHKLKEPQEKIHATTVADNENGTSDDNSETDDYDDEY